MIPSSQGAADNGLTPILQGCAPPYWTFPLTGQVLQNENTPMQ